MDTNKDDIKYTLELLKCYLPDFPVKKDDLLKPTPSFAIGFYHNYVNELEKECKLLFACNPLEDIAEICPRDIDRERFVFLFTRHILNKIGIQYFSMLDFYRPPNRTKTTIKACMYFLLYVKDNSLAVKEIINAFYQQLDENNLRAERIMAKKQKISDIAQNIGLVKEKIENVQKEYDAELQFESDLTQKGSELDKEIDELEKKFDAVSHNVRLQEQMLHSLKDEVHVLSDQVVSENDYEFFCKDSLKQLQIKIIENDRLADENTKVLETQHSELDRFKKAIDILKQVDMSSLDKAKEIDNLEEEIRQQESLKLEDIESQYEVLKANISAKTQSLYRMSEQFQEEETRMEEKVLEKNKQIQLIVEDIFSEKLMQEKLIREYGVVKKQLEASEKECVRLEHDQNLLEEEHQNTYKNLLTQQNLITTNFNSALEKLIQKYNESN